MDSRGWSDIAYCVDSETEILTADGWKRWDQVGLDDVALTLNHETGLAEWQPVLAVNVFPAQPREMLAMKGRSHSSLTTLNHRWPVERRRRLTGTQRQKGPDGKWLATGKTPANIAAWERRFVTSASIGYWDQIPCAAPVTNLPTEPKYDDAFVELVAWFTTEGHIKLSRGKPTTGINICQSHVANPHLVARIRACLTRLFGPAVPALNRQGDTVPRWRECTNGHKQEFFLNHVAGALVLDQAPGKVVRPSFVAALTEAQLRLFTETVIDGDGWRHGDSYAIAQKDPARLDAIQMAFALLGRRANLGEVLPAYPNMGPTLRVFSPGRGNAISPRPAALNPRGSFVMERVTYDGIVWCPTTPNGTWYARRRGTTYFTGNSWLVCHHGYRFTGRGLGVRSAAQGTNAGNDSFHAVCFLGADREGRADVTPEAKAAIAS